MMIQYVAIRVRKSIHQSRQM